MSAEFQVSTTSLGDGVAGVAVVGEADIYTGPELKQALNAAIEAGASYVLVDLSRATFIDSTTLGILMGAVRRLRPIGGEVAIACADANICRIFEITLLDRVFAIFPTTDEGLEHLRVSSTGSASTGSASTV